MRRDQDKDPSGPYMKITNPSKEPKQFIPGAILTQPVDMISIVFEHVTLPLEFMYGYLFAHPYHLFFKEKLRIVHLKGSFQSDFD